MLLNALIFPYAESIALGVLLARLQFTPAADDHRLVLDLTEDKQVALWGYTGGSVANAAIPTAPLEYIASPIPQVPPTDEDERSLRHHRQCPLIVQVPMQFCRLKLLVTFTTVPHNMETKLLLIIKLPATQRRPLTPEKLAPGAEVLKLVYTNLPLDRDATKQRLTINDAYRLTGFVEVLVWEYDATTDSHRLLFDFRFYAQPPPTPPAANGSSEKSLEPTTPVSPDTPVAKDIPVSVDAYQRQFTFVLEDGPDFRLRISRYELSFGSYKKLTLALYDELRAVDTAVRKLATSRPRLRELLLAVVDAHGPQMLRQLQFVAEFDRRLGQVFEVVEKNLRFIVSDVFDLSALRKMSQTLAGLSLSGLDGNETNELYQKKKRFELHSKEYYLWLNKYLSNEKDRPELKLLAKRKAFEVLKYDYMNQLDGVTNNQYANHWLEGLFKFIQLPYDPHQPHLLNFSQFRDPKQRDILVSDKYSIYLHAVSMFNLEKTKLRQLIEALQLNEELTTVLKHNLLNPTGASSNDAVVTHDSLSQIFDELGSVFTPRPNSDQTADMLLILYALGGQGKPGWHKEWVVLRNGLLMEYLDWRKGLKPINTPIAIALALIKPMTYDKRQNCFAIITLAGNKHVFQAIDADERSKWMKALYQAGQVMVDSQMPAIPRRRNSSDKRPSGSDKRPLSRLITDNDAATTPQAAVAAAAVSPVLITSRKWDNGDDVYHSVRLRPLANNHLCADCGLAEQVEWVLINWLVCVCVECALCHRNLGLHILKIRLLKLDTFDAEMRYLLLYVNNADANRYLEARRLTRPTPQLSHPHRLEYIRAKYRDRKFVAPNDNPDSALIGAIQNIDIPQVLKLIAQGGNVNMHLQINVPSTKAGAPAAAAPTPRVVLLFEYSLRKFVTMEHDHRPMFCVSQLLLLNGCNIDNIAYNHEIGLSEEAMAYWRLCRDKLGSH